MSKDPAFLFYTSDFLTGTSFMTDEEVGIYVRLLCQQHQCGGLLPSQFFIKRTENFSSVAEKFIKTDDGFYNKRLMEVIEARSKKCSNLSENAKKRWNDAKNMQLHKQLDMQTSVQLDMQTENENENENKEELNTACGLDWELPPAPSPEHSAVDQEVEEVYALYPSRSPVGGRSTGKCSKDKIKIKKLLSQKKPLKKIITEYIADCVKTKTFIKNFSTFLNNLPETPEETIPVVVEIKSALPKRHILTREEILKMHQGEES